MPTFRALSLDLWFTTFYHTAADAQGWDRSRAAVFRSWLVRPDRPALTEVEVAEATAAVGAGRQGNGYPPVTTDPDVVLRAVARRLGAEVRGRPGDAGRALSAAGLAEWPPRPNPEAEAVVRRLDQLGVPSVLVTNSARRAESWKAFLEARGGPPFRQVVSSTDLGVAKPDPEIFRAAARLLGVAPQELLHVGDRWELDVVGARAAGCGAVLYRGLWNRYPEEYGTLPEPPAGSEVPVVDDLRELEDPAWWRR